MKKFIAIMLTAVLTCMLSFSLVACAPSENAQDTKVMNVSLNPQVEFILDASNKVVSVNASNDEGNYVIATASFVGMDAEEALNAFVKISAENGFLLEGEVNAGKNNLKISISGEDAQKLYDEVKQSVTNYLSTLEANFEINFDFEQITKEDIEALVEDCMRELGVDEIKAKTQEELIKLLESSRKATEGLLSQELKDYYYTERALEIKQAQLDAYLEAVKASDPTGLATITLNAYKAQLDNLLEAIDEYSNKFTEYFLDQTSEYYQKMQELIAAKKELLEARLQGASEAITGALESAYELAQTTMNTVKSLAEAQIKIAYEAATSIIDTATQTIQTIIETLNLAADEITATVNASLDKAVAAFEDAFKTENKEYIDNNYWTGLKPETK